MTAQPGAEPLFPLGRPVAAPAALAAAEDRLIDVDGHGQESWLRKLGVI